MSRTKEQLTDAANEVIGAGTGENSADRIGNLFKDTIEHLNEDPAKVVTSSTSGLKIEIVSTMPQNPDSNTIYIVQ